MNTKTIAQFEVLSESQLSAVEGGGGVKNLIYGAAGGTIGGAGLGAAICSPLGPVAAGCGLLGGFYGLAAGVLAAGLDSK